MSKFLLKKIGFIMVLSSLILSFSQVQANDSVVQSDDVTTETETETETETPERKVRDIRLGQPGYGGAGCPLGSASMTVSPDKQSLKVLFDEYVAEAGGETGKTMDRKSCNFAIPISVPEGFSISLSKVTYNGYASIPRGGMGRLQAEYFFAGRRGPSFRKTFRGGFDDDFRSENRVSATGTSWSPCGQDVNLRFNTTILVRSNRNREDALMTIDSMSGSDGHVFDIVWRRCR